MSPYWIAADLSFSHRTDVDAMEAGEGQATTASASFRPVVPPAMPRGLTDLTPHQAVGWHAVYRDKQLEFVKRVYADCLSSLQETLELYEAVVYGVASASQTSKYLLLTTTGEELLHDGLLPFLWHWSPSHVLMDDLDGLSDGLFLTLPAANTLTVSASLHLPALLAQRRAVPRALLNDLLHVLQKSAGGGSAARTSLLRQMHRCQREEVHALLQHYCAAPPLASTLAASEGGEAGTGSSPPPGSKPQTSAEEDPSEDREGRHGLPPLPGLASFSAVEAWSHALPPSRSLEGDAVAGHHLLQSFLRQRPDRLRFLDALFHHTVKEKASSAAFSALESRDPMAGSSCFSTPLRFTVVTPFALDLPRLAETYTRAEAEEATAKGSKRTPDGTSALDDAAIQGGEPTPPQPFSLASFPRHSMQCMCVPFHYDPMRFRVLETEAETDVAIVHLSGLLERLHRASSSSSSSSPWWKREDTGPQDHFALRVDCWLWRVLSRVRWGVIVLAGRELFSHLPALGHWERVVLRNREVLSPSYAGEEDASTSGGGGGGGADSSSSSPHREGAERRGKEEEEEDEDGTGWHAGEASHSKRAAEKRTYWLPREAGCAVMAFQCGQHGKSRSIARVALRQEAATTSSSLEAEGSSEGGRPRLPHGIVHVVCHGTTHCRAACVLPYRQCTVSFHACLRPCHFMFASIPPLSFAKAFASRIPIGMGSAIRRMEETRIRDKEEAKEAESSSDDGIEEETSDASGGSTTRRIDGAPPAEIPSDAWPKGHTAAGVVAQEEAEEEHACCPYPCIRTLPHCGHHCQRKCGDRCPPAVASGGEEEAKDGDAEGPMTHTALSCPPCLVKGLRPLSCGQRVVSGVDPSDGKVQFQTFPHYQTRACTDTPPQSEAIACTEPVTLTCRRCGIRSTTPCDVLQAAKAARRALERVLAVEKGEVLREEADMDADVEDLLLHVTECRGCSSVIHRALAAVEGFQPWAIPPEHCDHPKMVVTSMEESVQERTARMALVTMVPVTAKDCTFLPLALQEDPNVHTLLTAAFARETRKAALLLRKSALEISNGRFVENSPLSLCQEAQKRHVEIMEKEKKSREEVREKEDEALLRQLREMVTQQVSLHLDMDGQFPLLESEALEEFHRQENAIYP